MIPADPIRALIESTRTHVAAYRELAPLLRAWPGDAECVAQPASSLPVVQWLERAAFIAPSPTDALARALLDAASSLAWRQTYARGTVDDAFLDSYGWTELIGARGLIASKALACGFLLLGPRTLYPPHQHEADETYLTLSGIAAWQDGSRTWRHVPPGQLVHHASFEPHAMRTDAEPLLALYLWRGSDVSERARFATTLTDRSR